MSLFFFFSMEEVQNAPSKKDLVSQGSVSQIMPAYCTLKWKWTFIKWLTSWTVSSLSHNEETVGGTDMAWKLCDKEECPKNQIACQIPVCSVWKWPDLVENNKEFWMGKQKGFPQSFVLVCARWTKVTLAFGRAPRSALKTISGGCSSDQNVLLMCGVHDITSHNLAAIASWFGEQVGHPYFYWILLSESIRGDFGEGD